MEDGEFEQAKSFTVQRKGFRQRGKKSKPNASVALSLTEGGIKLFYNKESFYLNVETEAAHCSFVQQDPFRYLGVATFDWAVL